MSVHTTSDKNILRVTFPIEGETASKNTDSVTEVVCFLRICDAGLETYYSHHVIRYRESNIGPFTAENARRMSLTPVLRAVIEQGVMYEFWSSFSRSLRTSPAKINQLPTDIPDDEGEPVTTA